MKKLLLIVLLIIGCATEPEDCAGVAGGTAEFDKCNVCDTDLTNDCVPDCIAGDGTDGFELWDVCYSIQNTTDLNLNQLTGQIPPEIGNLTNLTYLDLGWNQLTGEIPPEIGNLTNLTTLNLQGNELSGEIPPEIGSLTNLTHLRLIYNQLIGEIPSEIGNLVNLEILGLNHNQLSGEIPPEIGNLTNLIAVWLFNNQLIGIVPEEFCNLGLALSHQPTLTNNKLCPPYPDCVNIFHYQNQDTSNCP